MAVRLFTRRSALAALGVASASAIAMRPAFADRRWRDEDDDEDEKEEMRALQKAVDLGLVLPLAEVLARLKDRLPGRVVSVEIERKRDRFVYEFKVVDAGGRRREVYVDAASADILEID